MRVQVENLTIGGVQISLGSAQSLYPSVISQIQDFFKGLVEASDLAINFDNKSLKGNSNYLTLINQELNLTLQSQVLEKYIFVNTESVESVVGRIDTLFEEYTSTSKNTSSTKDLKFQELTAGMSEAQITSFKKLTDILVKIRKVDKEIADYQNHKSNKEDVEKKRKEKEDLKIKYEQQLASVSSFQERKSQVEKEIAAKSSGVINVEEITKIRDERINLRNSSFINGFRSESRHMFNDQDQSSESRFTLVRFMVPILFVIQIGLSLTYLLFNQNIVNIAINLLQISLITVLFIQIQKGGGKKKRVEEKREDFSAQLPKTLEVGNFDEDKKIINSAYINALKEELLNIEEDIKLALNNQSYQDVQKLLDQIKIELEDINKGGGEDANVLSIDDYYKKRRELDILKIEKDNIEFAGDLLVKPSDEYVDLVINDSNGTTSSSQLQKLFLPILLITKDQLFDELIARYNSTRQIIVLHETIPG